MKSITVRELRQHFPRVEGRLRRGETLEIRKRNKPVARLVPLSANRSARPDFKAICQEYLWRKDLQTDRYGNCGRRARPLLNAYADTGFLISLYGQDANSVQARALDRRHQPIYWVTEFGETEFTNAVQSCVFKQNWKLSEAVAVLRLFREHLETGALEQKALPAELWKTATSLLCYTPGSLALVLWMSCT